MTLTLEKRTRYARAHKMGNLYLFSRKWDMMWCARVFILFSITFNCDVIIAKHFETRCKLVREFLKVGMPQDSFLGQWVCLAEKVSDRNTSAFVETPSGRKYYGIFQIPSRWCRVGKRGGECNVSCESLLDDDITDDAACAVNIFNREGFKYWSKWTTRCKNDNHITNEIYKCPDLTSPRTSPDRYVMRPRRRLYKRSSLSHGGIIVLI